MTEPVRHVRQTISLEYQWSYGENLSEYFRRTRDERRFVGRRCPACRAVHVPPVGVCGKCYEPTDPEWIEVGPGGTLDSYTTVHLPFPGQPTEPPYIFALVLLDGADTHCMHRIGEALEEDLRLGMAVEAVWNDDRRGGMHDVLYFRPVAENNDDAGETAETAEPSSEAESQPAEEEETMSEEVVTIEEIFGVMQENFVASEAGDWKTNIQFDIGGEGGGEWFVEIGDGACKTGPGKVEEPKATVTTTVDTWVGLAMGKVNPQMAFMTGKVKIKGNMGDVLKMSNPKIFPKEKKA